MMNSSLNDDLVIVDVSGHKLLRYLAECLNIVWIIFQSHIELFLNRLHAQNALLEPSQLGELER